MPSAPLGWDGHASQESPCPLHAPCPYKPGEGQGQPVASRRGSKYSQAEPWLLRKSCLVLPGITEQHLVALLGSTDYVTSRQQGSRTTAKLGLCSQHHQNLINVQESPGPMKVGARNGPWVRGPGPGHLNLSAGSRPSLFEAWKGSSPGGLEQHCPKTQNVSHKSKPHGSFK